MYGRVTHFKSDPNRIDEMTGHLPAIRDKLAAIEGGVANWAMWNPDGTGIAVAIYVDETAADAAVPQIQDVWAGIAEFLLAPPEIVSYGHAEKMRG